MSSLLSCEPIGGAERWYPPTNKGPEGISGWSQLNAGSMNTPESEFLEIQGLIASSEQGLFPVDAVAFCVAASLSMGGAPGAW